MTPIPVSRKLAAVLDMIASAGRVSTAQIAQRFATTPYAAAVRIIRLRKLGLIETITRGCGCRPGVHRIVPGAAWVDASPRARIIDTLRPGGMTVGQMSERMGMSRHTIDGALRSACRDGIVRPGGVETRDGVGIRAIIWVLTEAGQRMPSNSGGSASPDATAASITSASSSAVRPATSGGGSANLVL